MKKNVGTADTVIRILIAVVIAALYFGKVISGTLAIVLGIAALVFLVTGLTGRCGLYKVFGISTCKVKTEAK